VEACPPFSGIIADGWWAGVRAFAALHTLLTIGIAQRRDTMLAFPRHPKNPPE